MTPLDVLLILVGLPPATVLAVTFAVMTSAAYARRKERGEPMDPFQERVFLTAKRPSPVRLVAGMSVEGFWQTAALALQGMHRVRRFPNPPLEPGAGPPVILVGGYLESAGQMWLLARRLRAAGFQSVLLDLPSTFHSLERNAAFVGERAREIAEQSGYARVGYVGHSMGGVVGRTYVHSVDEPHLGVVIALGSPHRGTNLAWLGPGQSARDMRPGSEHMRRYPPSRIGAVPIHTIVSTQDNIVSPAWSTVLPEGETVVLEQPVGHVSPMYLRGVAAQVLTWLEQAELAPRALPAPEDAPETKVPSA